VHEKSVLMPMFILALLAPCEPWAAALHLPISTASLFPLLLRDGQAVPYAALTAAAATILPALAAGNLYQAASPVCMGKHVGKSAENRRDSGTQQPQVDDVASTAAVAGVVGVATRGMGGVQARSRKKGPVAAADPEGHDQAGSNSAVKGCGDERCGHTELSAHAQRPGVGQAGTAAWMWQALCAGSVCVVLALHAARLLIAPPDTLPFLHDAALTAFVFVHLAGLLVYSTFRQLCCSGPAESW
jgi:hypothetical protein